MAKLVLIDDNGNEKIIKEGNIISSDIILRNDAIAVKKWSRQDIAEIMEEMDIYPSSNNIDDVHNSGLLKYLEDCTDDEWNIIRNAVSACKKDKVFSDDITCDNLKTDADLIAELELSDYCTYKILVPAGYDINHLDVAACMEETLHRFLEVGASDEIIRSELGMAKDEEEIIPVDLGYSYSSEILSIAIFNG